MMTEQAARSYADRVLDWHMVFEEQTQRRQDRTNGDT